MYQRGIRGAITLERNDESSVREGVKELISEIVTKNEILAKDISHVIFTLTRDIDCVYPAKMARELFDDWQYVPLMCISELGITDSLNKCLRVLIVINTEKSQTEIKHVYLKGAAKLRRDLK